MSGKAIGWLVVVGWVVLVIIGASGIQSGAYDEGDYSPEETEVVTY